MKPYSTCCRVPSAVWCWTLPMCGEGINLQVTASGCLNTGMSGFKDVYSASHSVKRCPQLYFGYLHWLCCSWAKIKRCFGLFRFYGAEILCGLQFLHSKGIIYRWVPGSSGMGPGNCLSTSCIFEFLIDVTSTSCLSEIWCSSKAIHMPEMNLYLCGFSLATGMMEWYLCYTKTVLSQLFSNTAFSSWACLVWRWGRGSLRISVPTGPEQTTEVKGACFCLLVKAQYWCCCLKHQGPDPDPLRVLGTSVTQEKRLPCSYMKFSALFQSFLVSRGLFSFSAACPPWYVHLQPDGQKMHHGQREGM